MAGEDIVKFGQQDNAPQELGRESRPAIGQRGS